MRRLVFFIGLLALAMPVSLASAKHAPVNHVSGDVTLEFPRGDSDQIMFDVTGDPLSTAASGSFHKHSVFHEVLGIVEIDMTGLVDCLRVVGDTAYMSGVITASMGTVPPGTPFFQSVRDTSPAGTGDTVSATFVGAGATCFLSEPPEFVIASGNIVIEQCDWINGSGKCKTKD
jgi:hypothetical protein